MAACAKHSPSTPASTASAKASVTKASATWRSSLPKVSSGAASGRERIIAADINEAAYARRQSSRERVNATPSDRLGGAVAVVDVARDPSAFGEIAPDHGLGIRRTGAVDDLVTAETAVEGAREPLPARLCLGLGVKQRRHFGAPRVSVTRAADIAEVRQSAEDFGEPQQLRLVGRRRPFHGGLFSRGGRGRRFAGLRSWRSTGSLQRRRGGRMHERSRRRPAVDWRLLPKRRWLPLLLLSPGPATAAEKPAGLLLLLRGAPELRFRRQRAQHDRKRGDR